MAASTNDFGNGGLGRPLAWSAGLHVAASAFVLLWATYITGIRGQGWAAAEAATPWGQPW